MFFLNIKDCGNESAQIRKVNLYDVYFSFEIYPGNHIENVDKFWDFAFGVFII